MKSDTVKIQPLPYGLGYSTWSKNRSATKAQQEEYVKYEQAQAAIRERERLEQCGTEPENDHAA